MLRASERRQVADDVCEIIEAGARVVLEVAPDPSGCRPAVTPGVLMRDQGDELERLLEIDLSQFARPRFGD